MTRYSSAARPARVSDCRQLKSCSRNDPEDERGNPDLKPERSKGLNVSLGGSPGGAQGMLHWEVTAFARDINDLIDYSEVFADPVTNQYVFENVPGTVKVRGAALDLTGSFSQDFSAGLSYTHNHARLDDGGQLSRIPEDVTKASVDFHPASSRFGATIAVNYVGNVFANIDGYPTDRRRHPGNLWKIHRSRYLGTLLLGQRQETAAHA